MAVSCAKLGTHAGQCPSERRAYLRRGLAILYTLKDASRLLPSQDWTAWFKKALLALDEEG